MLRGYGGNAADASVAVVAALAVVSDYKKFEFEMPCWPRAFDL